MRNRLKFSIIFSSTLSAVACIMLQAKCSESRPSPKKAKENMELGEMLLFNGHPAAGQKALEDAAQQDPDLVQVHIDLANLYANKNAEAYIKELEAIVRLKPKDSNARSVLAGVQNAQGRYKEAVANYQTALSDSKEPDHIRLELAFARLNAGQPENALEDFNKLPNKEDSRVLLGLAMCNFKLGKSTTAGELLDRVIKQTPNSAEAYCLKGDLLYSQQEKAKAIEQYQIAINQDPAFLQAYTSLGSLYLNEGRYDDSKKIFLQAAKLKPQNCDALYGLALSLEKCGEIEAATKVYMQALQFERQNDRKAAIQEHISRMNKI